MDGAKERRIGGGGGAVRAGSGHGGVVRTPGKGSWILGQHLAVHLAESVERSGCI